MRLLLDEMHAPAVAEALVASGHDVVAVAVEPELRGCSDRSLQKRGCCDNEHSCPDRQCQLSRAEMFDIANDGCHDGRMATNDSLGSRLRDARTAQSLSLTEVAARAGISKAYLSQLEHGASTTPSHEVLRRLATALGASIADLTGASETWQPGEANKLPASLRAFARSAKIPEADVEMLAGIHYRGKQPGEPDDWAHIYETIKRTVR